jgi:hypothetical protein
MSTLVGFAVGFISGWAARSTVESSRAAVVGVASTVLDLLDRAKRAAAVEGDYLEDFVAEIRARAAGNRPWGGTPAGASSSNGSGAAANAARAANAGHEQGSP